MPDSIRFFLVAVCAAGCLFMSGLPAGSGASGGEIPQIQKSGDATALDQYYRWVEMGPAAIPEIKSALETPDWRMRPHALLAVGRIGDGSLAPLALDSLKNDGHPAVKNCAVMALGDLKEKSAVPVLIRLIGEDPETAGIRPRPQERVVVQALGKIGDSRAVRPLFNLLLASRNQQLRIEITEALIAIGDPEISRLLQGEKPGPDPFPHVEAARIIGALPVDGSEAFLLKLLENDALPVKNAAILSIGKIRSEKSVPALLTLLKTGNSGLLPNLSRALIAIDSGTAVPDLCGLMGSADPALADSAALILSRMTDREIPGGILTLLEKNHAINGPAAFVLGQKKWMDAAPLIQSRLADENEPGQDRMAEALGWMEDYNSIPLLMNVASRKSKKGSGAAIWALGQLRAGQAIPLLRDILKRQDRQLTGPALLALGEIGDPGTVKPIIDLYYESGFQYQLQVALALARIGGPEVAEILKTNMESENPKRRKMAGFMLMKSRDPALVPYAISLLDHPEETIQRYALAGLRNITGENFESPAEWESWAKAKDLK